MHMVEVRDALAEAGDYAQALIQAIRGKLEEPALEDAAVERLAALVRDRVEAAGKLLNGGA